MPIWSVISIDVIMFVVSNVSFVCPNGPRRKSLQFVVVVAISNQKITYSIPWLFLLPIKSKVTA